ncbi:kallikrein-14-like [Meleagris gallopavo]|uniref:kallikrein-14-like n=1 Tax=Meleagris gallopavo TaxID=9103 RepID=UPI00093F7412|nr:kallikrein-14-like [Meleagris gallopavo]
MSQRVVEEVIVYNVDRIQMAKQEEINGLGDFLMLGDKSRTRPTGPSVVSWWELCSISRIDLRVLIGTDTLRDGTGEVRTISRSIVHPSYNPRKNDNDFMLLRLNKPVRFSNNIKKIRLATRCPTDGMRCSVSGWGTTRSPGAQLPRDLQCAGVQAFGREKCMRAYGRSITPNMFCAGVPRAVSIRAR